MRRLLSLSLLVLAVAIVSPERVGAQDQAAFAPGQVWSIRSAISVPTRVVIGRIETLPTGVAVHVSLLDVVIPNGAPGAGGTTRIAHVPFDETALRASVDKLVGVGAEVLPAFETGYQQWRDDKGGIFTVTVSEVIELVFRAM